MNQKIQRILFHLLLAALTLGSVGAIGWVVVDSLIMPKVAREGWEVVEVPDVQGLSADQAAEKLAQVGLDPLIDPERRKADRIGPDLVALQRPASRDSVKRGHVVRLWLSAGASTVPVPELSGQDSSEAFTHIQESGLKVSETEYVTSPKIPAGKVVRTDPVGGTLLVRGSSLKILFSSGSDPDSTSQDSGAAVPKPPQRVF